MTVLCQIFYLLYCFLCLSFYSGVTVPVLGLGSTARQVNHHQVDWLKAAMFCRIHARICRAYVAWAALFILSALSVSYHQSALSIGLINLRLSCCLHNLLKEWMLREGTIFKISIGLMDINKNNPFGQMFLPNEGASVWIVHIVCSRKAAHLST